MPAYLGNAPIKKLYLGGTPISKLHLGATMIWQSVPSMGVDKVGNQTIGSTYTWTTITGRAVRAGYPDTVITSDGLLIPAGVTFTLACQNTHSQAHADTSCRLFNTTTSTVIATAPAGSTATPTASATFTPSVDSVVVVQGYVGSALSGRNIISAGAGTFLTAVPA